MKHSPAMFLAIALGSPIGSATAQDIAAPWFERFADEVRASLQQLRDQVAENTAALARHEEMLMDPVHAARLEFGPAHISIRTRYEVSAFTATGSLSPRCLVTLSESNFAVPGLSTFCAPRILDGQEGLFIHIFSLWPLPSNLILSATVYQERAHSYPAPVLYPY